MPIPVSVTEIATRPPARSAEIRTWPPGGVDFTALEPTLMRARSNCVRSTCTGPRRSGRRGSTRPPAAVGRSISTHLADEVADRGVLGVGLQAGRLDAVEHQEVLDEAAQPRGVPRDDPERVALAVVQLAVVAVLEQLGGTR